jgi:putative peptide zinc metalloprotease protein
VAIHELAHGLTMASLGRRVDRVGFKAFLIIPYAFVDTSEAWFEPRRRRIAISAAGPTSDFALGGLFAVLSVFVDGTLREVFFQLAFGAYIGGLFNLNPFLDRDGYHIMVDVLRMPGLRARAKAQFERRAKGDKREEDSRALRIYSVASIVWLALMGAFVVGMSLRYEPVLVRLAPELVVHVVMYTIWVGVFLPFVFAVGKPLVARIRR